MPYQSKAEREAASCMTWTEILAHVQKETGCDEKKARRQIGDRIADGVLSVMWADQHKVFGWPGPLQVPDDGPPRDALYWLECETDPTDPDCVLEPRFYDPGLVDKRTAKRLDRKRRFRKPIFQRDQVLWLWPQARGSARIADEKRATGLLRDSLKADKNLKRPEALAICRKHFPKLSERKFKSRVWPDARVAAGLDRTAPAGRKPKPQRA